jgi:hypothetical protein
VNGPRPQPDTALPAMVRHVVVFCRARQHLGADVTVRAEGTRKYVVTIRCDGLEVTLTFTRRSRSWELTGKRIVKVGEPAGVAGVAAALALLAQREGTAGSSPVRAGPPQCRNDVAARRDSVIRV